MAIAGRDEPFDNSGPNSLHAEPAIAAAELCDAIVCSPAGGRRELVPNR